MKNDDIINQILTICNNNKELLLVCVYGSFANGKNHDKSDIDIAVATNDILGFDDKVNLAAELSHKLKLEIDLVDLNNCPFILLKEILHTATWVIKKDKILLAALIKKMLYESADFEPYYQRMLKAKRKRILGI